MNNDVYAEVTAQIVESLENGVKPWIRPWDADVPLSLPRNALTGDRYRGINVLLLWQAQHEFGFSGHRWTTYRQAQELLASHAKDQGINYIKKSRNRGKGFYFADENGQPLGGVRKGASGVRCLKYKPIEAKFDGKQDTDGDENDCKRFVLRRFTLFNTDQVDGLSENKAPPSWCDMEDIELLFFHSESLIPVHHEGTQAYYNRVRDEIVLPERRRFDKQSDYYATRFHELVHAVGSPDRLARTQGEFGTPEYAFEELVAELGAAFLCAHFGINGHVDGHDQYIASWIHLLNDDKKAIKKAASLADKAATFIIERFSRPTH